MNKKFLAYILKRILLGILTYFIVVTITFWIMQLVPGGPFNKEGRALTPEQIAVLNAKYGLDKPLGIQYLVYLGRAATLDFGPSIVQKGSMINNIIGEAFPHSLIIGSCAALLALFLGVIFGTYAATHQNKFFDRFIMVITTASVAVPSFVISLILLYIFCVNLHWLPTSYASGGAASYVLPIIAESLYPTAYITRLMRSSTLDILGQDYMRTARAKGLTPTRILMKHGSRNAITPVVTYFGPMFASIITGSLVIEQIFQVPGLGRCFYNGIFKMDYPLIMATTCVLSLLLIGFTILSDILYKIVNPRVDFE